MVAKMKYTIEHLLRENLLARIPKSKDKAKDSIKAANEWIAESKNNIFNKSFKSAILTAYLGMFHAARAILYLDGFREKSHFAVARYLENIYVGKGKLEVEWVEMLDYCRELRHSDQYRTSFIITKEEANEFLDKAEKFVKRLENLLNEEVKDGEKG
jgi:uncharacterized protein (UPF0332 family)